jgi:hypothetical protein
MNEKIPLERSFDDEQSESNIDILLTYARLYKKNVKFNTYKIKELL